MYRLVLQKIYLNTYIQNGRQILDANVNHKPNHQIKNIINSWKPSRWWISQLILIPTTEQLLFKNVVFFGNNHSNNACWSNISFNCWHRLLYYYRPDGDNHRWLLVDDLPAETIGHCDGHKRRWSRPGINIILQSMQCSVILIAISQSIQCYSVVLIAIIVHCINK